MGSLTAKERPLVSIIVLVYNRPELTKQCLDTLFDTLKNAQTSHEVIIVNNGSLEPTAQVLKSYEDRATILNLYPNVGIGKGKNAGVNISQGEYLYISDNDIAFKPGWLDTLFQTYTQNLDISVLGGFRHPHHGVLSRLNNIELSDQQVGSSWFLSRDVWDVFGPLDEGLGYGGDDSAFCNRIIERGGLVGSIHPYLVVHCGATNTDGFDAAGAELIRQQEGVVII